MQLITLHDVDLAGLEDAVGARSFARGIDYARQHAVVSMSWDPSELVLYGTVHGQAGDFYETSVRFSADRGTPMGFEYGECGCPVEFDCKHVAALVLTAVDAQRPGATPAPKVPPAVPWERSLGSLLESESPARAARPCGAPLAVELTLAPGVAPASSARRGMTGAASSLSSSPSPSPPRVLARVVRPGKNGRWVAGGLSWTKLVAPHYYGDVAPLPAHARVLRELYAVYGSGGTRSGYYSYSEEKTIDLAAFESRQLWPILEEAERVGVRLVHGKAPLGAVPRDGSARLCLDVTRDGPSGALLITPVIRVDTGDEGAGVDALPVRFVGAEGHGLVYTERVPAPAAADQSTWPLRLARFERPVAPPLQRMALDGGRLEIPAAERSRFVGEYYPRLRHLAEIVSSDGSFTPPAISDPTLVLRAAYGAEHDLELNWEWAYQVGETRMRAPLHPNGTDGGYRDPDAERALLNGLDVPLKGFSPPLERTDRATDPVRSASSPPAPPTTVAGVDTMRFTTEVLPLLADCAGVSVEITGDPADYREATDSLRIAVSTGEVAGETDWFDLGVTITVEGRPVPFTDVFLALDSGQSHLLLADGAYFSLDKPELQSLRTLIDEARQLRDSPSGSLTISRFQAGLWAELAELGVVTHQARAWQRQVQGLLSLDSGDPTALAGPAGLPPPTVRAELRPYQLDGLRWLAFLWENRLGGILADDMGLGKTLQALALICHAKQVEPAGAPFLIVAPTSVVSNWAAEAARFAPDLTVVAVSDTLRKRGQALDEVIAGADVVVTSYTLLRLDVDAYSATDWSGLILDEAQFAKNHQSKVYQCARRVPAPFKLAITGTPMENNLMELWSLMSITAPGLFPNPHRFQEHYAKPIEKRGSAEGAELLARLRRRIKPLMKRRTKEQVAADLPPKQEQILQVDLHPRHRKLYQTHLQRERRKVLGLIDDVNKNRFTILRSLTLLRQLSLHAGLVDDQHHDLPSAKIDALLEQLTDVIDGGHRALVFSQFTGFLDVARRRLDEAGVRYCYLDGSTRNRPAVLASFKDGSVPVFLISLKAGGFGLNLTEADYCFLLDPWWNPATEAQAVDRTHRIGQTRNVMVYRLIAKDTIESKVMALKARKAELFSSVMDEGNVFGTGLDAADIRGLFE